MRALSHGRGATLLLLAGLVGAHAAAGQPPPRRPLRAADVDAMASAPADLRVAYGPDSLQFGELRLPAGAGPFPVAVVVHGCCWSARRETLRNTAPLADALRRAGVATWNVEYRRVGHPGGGWPGTFLDVAAAADHVRELARRVPLDTTRVVAVGHSAGGHLALWLAARPRLDASSPLATAAPLRLAGAVSLGGPPDLRAFARIDRGICDGPAVAPLLGGAPDAVPARAADGSPAELLPLGVPPGPDSAPRSAPVRGGPRTPSP